MAAAVAGIKCGLVGLREWRDMACELPRGSSRNSVLRKAAQRLSLHAGAAQRCAFRKVVRCLDCSDSGMSQEQVASEEVVEWRAQHAEFQVREGQSLTQVRATEWDGTRVSECSEGEREVARILVETSDVKTWKGDEVTHTEHTTVSVCRLVLDKNGAHLEEDGTASGTPSRRGGGKKLERSYSKMARDPKPRPKVGPVWREVQGKGDWKEMLEEELNPVLRAELVRYGEFAQACYDAFDGDTTSRYCGSCKYDQEKLLESVGLPDTGYAITKYIYATSQDLHLPKFFAKPDLEEDAWMKDSNWVGFVAVCMAKSEIDRLGRRDILVAWRGTCTRLEWKENVRDYLTPMHPPSPGPGPGSSSPASMPLRGPISRKDLPGPLKVDVKVEKGFYHMYSSTNANTRFNKHSAQTQVLDAVKSLVTQFQDEHLSITITGHSLGGALAILSAHDICEQAINRYTYTPPPDHHNKDVGQGNHIPVTVFNFAAPRVGNEAFRHRLEKELNVKVLRVVNDKDTVPMFPGFFTNEKFPLLCSFLDWLPWTYSHVGVELRLSSVHSKLLDHAKSDLVANHNLELYLHLVDAFRSRQQPFANFDPETSRDLALLNKSNDILDKRLRVPPCWWQQENKGVKFNKARQRWMRAVRDDEDVPVIVDRYHAYARNRDADDIPVNIDRQGSCPPP